MANYTLKVFSRGTVAARERGRFHSPVLATSDIRSNRECLVVTALPIEKRKENFFSTKSNRERNIRHEST